MNRVLILSIVMVMPIWVFASPDYSFFYVKGKQAFHEARYDSALYYFKSAANLLDPGHDTTIFDIESQIISVLWRKSDFKEADRRVKAISLPRNLHEVRGGQYIQLLARNAYYQGQYYEAIQLYDSARSTMRASKDQNRQIEIFIGKSRVNIKIFRTDSALAAAQAAEELYHRLDKEDPLQLGVIYDLIGQVEKDRGNFDKAITYFKKAQELKGKVQNEEHPDMIGLLNNIGIVYRRMMQYDKALEYYGASLELRKKTLGENHLQVSHSYNNIGYVLFNKKNFEEGMAIHRKALAIRQSLLGDDHYYTLQSIEQIGLCYGGLRQFDEAEKYFTRTLNSRIKRFGRDYHFVSYSYYNLGAVAEEEKDYVKARDYFQQAADVGSRIYKSRHLDQADNFNRIARCYLALEEWEKAKRFFHLSLEQNLPGYDWGGSFDTIPNTDHYLSFKEVFRSVVGLASAYSGEPEVSNLNLALGFIASGETILANYKSSFTNENDRIKISAYTRLLSDEALKIHHELYQIDKDDQHLEEMFKYAESTRTTAILSSIADEKARRISNISADLLTRERGYRELKDSLNSEIIKKLSEEDGANLAELRASLLEVVQDHEELMGQLERDYPEYAQKKYGIKPIAIPELQLWIANHNQKINVLHYYLTLKGDVYASVITQNDQIIKLLRDEHLMTEISRLRESIVTHNPDSFRIGAHQVYKMLIAPIRSFLDEDADLVIIPDGALAYVPFDVLLTETGDQSYHQLPYLLHDFCISYDLSATLFAQRPRKSESGDIGDLVAYAPEFEEGSNTSTQVAGLVLRSDELVPLTGAYKEATSISQRMNGELRQKEKATESLFKKEAQGFKIIHLATHSIINEGNPGYSKLMFSASDEEDGQLHAFELENMDLNAELVTLSACSTGFGKFEEGEGVMSLARAFSVAGVPSVVMSLWPASDEHTAKLMDLFYENLQQGKAKNKAMHLAKQAYLRQSDPLGANPFHWSSFVLIGDTSPIKFQSNSSQNILFILGTIVLVGMILLGLKRLKLFQ